MLHNSSQKRGEVWRQVTMVAKFLDLYRDGHLHCRKMEKKVWATVLLLNAIMHREDCIHIICFVFFVLWPWQRDVRTSFSIREGTCLLLVLLPRSLARNVLTSRRQSLGTPNILYFTLYSKFESTFIKWSTSIQLPESFTLLLSGANYGYCF